MDMHGKHINVLYSRHGVSCGNLSHALSSYKLINRDDNQVPDPALTVDGIKRTKLFRNQIKARMRKLGLKPTIYACSELMRAIETGLMLFEDEIRKGSKLNVLPHVKESGNHPHNQAIAREEQLEIIGRTEGFKRFNFYRGEEPDVIWRADEINNGYASNYDLFLDWIADNVVLEENLTIFVVSHGNFIAEDVLKTNYILDNNDTVHVKYRVVRYRNGYTLIPESYQWVFRTANETEEQFIQRIQCDVCSEV